MSRLKKALSAYGRDLAEGINSSAYVPWQVRWRVLRARGGRVAGSAIISPGVVIRYGRMDLGERVYISSAVVFDDGAGVTIGNDVAIGPGARIVTSAHFMEDPARRAGEAFGARVAIGDGCWIGAGATILPGVRVARGCVVAAGAVVTKDTAPDGLYMGVPARRMRDLPTGGAVVQVLE